MKISNLEGPEQFEDSATYKSLKKALFFCLKRLNTLCQNVMKLVSYFWTPLAIKPGKFIQHFLNSKKLNVPSLQRVNLNNLVSGRKKGCCKYTFVK